MCSLKDQQITEERYHSLANEKDADNSDKELLVHFSYEWKAVNYATSDQDCDVATPLMHWM